MQLKYLILLALVIAFNTLSAQQSTSFSTYLSSSDSPISLSSTIGDVFVTSHSTEGNLISQGYLQKENHFYSELKENNLTSLFIYPNPSSTLVYLMNSNAGQHQFHLESLELIDMRGVKIKHFKMSDVLIQDFAINIESLSPGIYFLKLSTKNEQRSIKLIKL